jgi:hypothetical protein
MIIHAGDISLAGKPDEIQDFIDWFSSLRYKYKIFIAGIFMKATVPLCKEVQFLLMLL